MEIAPKAFGRDCGRRAAAAALFNDMATGLLSEFVHSAAQYRDAVSKSGEDPDSLDELACTARNVAVSLLESEMLLADDPGASEVMESFGHNLLLDFPGGNEPAIYDATLLHRIGWDLVHPLCPLLSHPAAAAILNSIAKVCNPREIHLVTLERLSLLEVTERDGLDLLSGQHGKAREVFVMARMLLEATQRIRRGKPVTFLSAAVSGFKSVLELLSGLLGACVCARIDADLERKLGPHSATKEEPDNPIWPTMGDELLDACFHLTELVGGSADLTASPLPPDDSEESERRYLLLYLYVEMLGKIVGRLPLGLLVDDVDAARGWNLAKRLGVLAEFAGLDTRTVLSSIATRNSTKKATIESDDDGLDEPSLVARFPLSKLGSAFLVCLGCSGDPRLPKHMSWDLDAGPGAVSSAIYSATLLFQSAANDVDTEAGNCALACFQKLEPHFEPLSASTFTTEPATPILSLLRAAELAMCSTPSPKLRTAIFKALLSFASEASDEVVLHMAGDLLRPGPYVGLAVAGIAILKDAFQRGLQKHATGMFNSSAAGRLAMQLVFDLDAPVHLSNGGKPDPLDERHEVAMHALNLYVYLLMRDQRNEVGVLQGGARLAPLPFIFLDALCPSQTGIWSPELVAAVESRFIAPLRQAIADVKGADDEEMSSRAALLDDMLDRADSLRRRRLGGS